MTKFKTYFKDIFSQAGTLLKSEVNYLDEGDDYFNFECAGITYQCVLIKLEDNKVILRTFVNALKADVFKDSMYDVYEIMNRFNLLEGGLFKLVAIENEGEEYMSIALKTIDVVATEELIDNNEVRYYHLNLIADMLMYANVHEIYQTAYFDQIEEYNEFE